MNAMKKNNLFTVKNLSVAYDKKIIIRDISFDIPEACLMAIVGPNGAGKSTLLKATLGLIPKISGSIESFGKPFKGHHKKIAYVPQRENVDWDFPVSVFDVALMGTYGKLRWCQRPSHKEKEVAARALDDVGMFAFKDHQISQLSGGQQQRTFLARALAQEAELYFMDEPFAGVDAATEDAIMQVFRKIKEQGKMIVAVHHNLDTVDQYFDHMILLKQHLVATGPVQTVLNEKNLSRAYGCRMTGSKFSLAAGAI